MPFGSIEMNIAFCNLAGSQHFLLLLLLLLVQIDFLQVLIKLLLGQWLMNLSYGCKLFLFFFESNVLNFIIVLDHAMHENLLACYLL